MSTGFVEVVGVFFSGDDAVIQTKPEIHYIINTNEIYCVSKRADGRATICLNNDDYIVTNTDFEEYRRMLCGSRRGLFDDSE